MKTSLTTTNNCHALKLIIFRRQVSFQNIPEIISDSEVLLFLKNKQGVEYNQQIFPQSGRISYRIPSLPNGIYSFNIYIKKGNGNTFWSYHKDDDILLSVTDDTIIFYSSPFSLQNNIRHALFPQMASELKKCLLPSRTVQCNNAAIVSIAKEITKGKLFDYIKALVIHDWVADNIYYDNDAIKDRSYIHSDNSALMTLMKRKNVCQGYTNLTVALLRAIGIPSFVLSCFSLGESTDWNWEDENNIRHHDSNHVITAAYVNKRWLLMDSTWDSDNYIENGIWMHKTGLGVLHRYFDSSISFLSNTHILVRKYDY